MIGRGEVKLEPTAAFVMALAIQLFSETELTRKFLEKLDLSSAADLIEDSKKHGILELTQQLMCDRKFMICRCLMDQIAVSHESVQVVILAAGKSPLGLEVLNQNPQKITRIFEIDVSSFDQKEEVYFSLLPKSKEKISFIQKDIFADDLIKVMEKSGFQKNKKSILVMEGITHYMPVEKCEKLLSIFASRASQNVVIFEYAPPFETLADWVRPKAIQAYKIVEERYYIEGMTKYTPEWLDNTLKTFGGKLEKVFPMNEMEKLRTGRNQFFKEKNSGWVEVAVGRF